MSKSFRFAHLSDPHLALPPRWGQYNLKRAVGRINWLLNRRRHHHAEKLSAAVQELLRDPPQLLLITGDFVQTGLPQEFTRVRVMLAPLVAASIPVLIVNGNHDCYGAETGCTPEFIALRNELSFRASANKATFSTTSIVTHRFAAVEVTLFDQAKPNSVFRAGGGVDCRELSALQREQNTPTDGVMRIACGHYPLLNFAGQSAAATRGLAEDEARGLGEYLRASGTCGYFCGHDHIPYEVEISASCRQFCAGSITNQGRLTYYEIRDGRIEEGRFWEGRKGDD